MNTQHEPTTTPTAESSAPRADEGAAPRSEGTHENRPAWWNPRIIGLLLSVIAAVVIFTAINPNFFTTANVLTLAQTMSSVAILSLGLTFIILTGELDLSIGAIFGFVPMVTALLWVGGTPMVMALLIGVATGAFIGFVNGFLVTRLDIPSFIVTLGSMNIIYGFTLLISKARAVDPAYADTPVSAGEFSVFRSLAASQPFEGFSSHILWFLGVAAILWVLRHRTLFGFRLIAIGGSVDSARTAKLPVKRYVVFVFVLGGLLAGLAGILEFSFLGSTDPNAGQNLLFPAFAAVIVGGSSLNGGVGTIGGTVVGAVLLSVLSNGLSLVGIGSFAQLIFVGSITIGAVALDRWTTSKHQPGTYR